MVRGVKNSSPPLPRLAKAVLKAKGWGGRARARPSEDRRTVAWEDLPETDPCNGLAADLLSSSSDEKGSSRAVLNDSVLESAVVERDAPRSASVGRRARGLDFG